MKLLITCLCACLSIYSCTTKSQPSLPDNIPTPLNDEKVADVNFSKRETGDMVENLFDDLKKDNAQLKDLATRIKHIPERKNDSLEILAHFEEKNDDFYHSVERHLQNIQDSTLKKYVAEIIENSVKNYENRIAPVKKLIEIINSKNSKLKDVYTMLKLVKTLPIMYTYQQSHAPTLSLLQDVNTEYDKLIQQTEKLAKN